MAYPEGTHSELDIRTPEHKEVLRARYEVGIGWETRPFEAPEGIDPLIWEVEIMDAELRFLSHQTEEIEKFVGRTMEPLDSERYLACLIAKKYVDKGLGKVRTIMPKDTLWILK